MRSIEVEIEGKKYTYAQDCVKRGSHCQITQHPLNFWVQPDNTFDFGSDDSDVEILAAIKAA